MTQPPSGAATGSPARPAPRRTQPPTRPAGGAPPASAGRRPARAVRPASPGVPAAAAAPKKSAALLIASLALAVGRAALRRRRHGRVPARCATAEDGQGAKEPAVAVDGFLTAVYQDRDADRGGRVRLRRRPATTRRSPRRSPRWRSTPRSTRTRGSAGPRPKVDNQTGDRATVSTRLTMTTADEKVAEQELRFTVVQKTGWWVCEVG